MLHFPSFLPLRFNVFLFLCVVVFPATIHAQLDTNANGMSDVWERLFNDDELCPPTFLPADDADGEGYTNLLEAIAGTDPFDPNDSFKSDIRCVPEVWFSDPEEEEPILLSPEAFEITWHAVAGKRYVLLCSPDLSANSWIPVGNPIEGYDWPVTVAISPQHADGIRPDKLFWKVEVQDVWSNGGSLTDYEKYLLGLDRYTEETLPGIPDEWLATHFINLLLNGGLWTFDPNGDADNDGISNLEELLGGSDPNTEDTPDSQRWLALHGTGNEDEPLTKSRQLTIPAGQSALVLVALASDEYPYWTSGEVSEEFNDILTWNIEPSEGDPIEGEIDVNSRHDDWMIAEFLGETLTGLPGPVHYEEVRILTAPPDEPLTVDVDISATNIEDGWLPSHIAVGVLPVRVQEVSFAGAKYHELKSDDLQTTYDAPHWQRPQPPLAVRDYAVAYTRNSVPGIGGELHIPGLPEGLVDQIRLVASDGIEIPAQAVEAAPPIVKMAPANSSTPFPDTIKYYPRDDEEKAFQIHWEIRVAPHGWHRVATTRHQLYLTLNDPLTSLRQETLFELGCRRATGETVKAETRSKIYTEFQTRLVSRISDEMILTYWKFDLADGIDTSTLLASVEGSGNCNAWAHFFRDILRVQGIEANLASITPIDPVTLPAQRAIAVKEWTFNGAGSAPLPNPYIYGIDAIPGDGGILAQNNGNPPKLFVSHYVTLSDGIIYDPSYGTPPMVTTKEYEDGSFAGYGTFVGPANFPEQLLLRKNNILEESESEILINLIIGE